MTLVALTGGIGSGKSTIASRFRELGAYTVDSDQLARQAVQIGSPGLQQIVARFGEDVLETDGTLNRSKLGAIVFAGEHARKDLESITHPEVRRLAKNTFAHIYDHDPHALIVYEIPLLVETGAINGWDGILLADAPAEIRIERLVHERGLSREEARRRVANQASDDERRAVATWSIDTSTRKAATIEQVDHLYKNISRT